MFTDLWGLLHLLNAFLATVFGCLITTLYFRLKDDGKKLKAAEEAKGLPSIRLPTPFLIETAPTEDDILDCLVGEHTGFMTRFVRPRTIFHVVDPHGKKVKIETTILRLEFVPGYVSCRFSWPEREALNVWIRANEPQVPIWYFQGDSDEYGMVAGVFAPNNKQVCKGAIVCNMHGAGRES
jgi:hypothetical protein